MQPPAGNPSSTTRRRRANQRTRYLLPTLYNSDRRFPGSPPSPAPPRPPERQGAGEIAGGKPSACFSPSTASLSCSRGKIPQPGKRETVGVDKGKWIEDMSNFSCSVTCFKKHKEESCQKTLVQEEISKPPLQEEVTRGSGLVEDGTKRPNDKDQHPSLSPNTTCPAKSPKTVCPIKALEVEDPSWLVDNNKLRSLAEVKEIRDALRDPELQKMILKVDGSSESEKELEKVMEGQTFRQFTNKILDIVSPQE